MNARAANALYDAERRGVVQITGKYGNSRGGRCAIGVLADVQMAWALYPIAVEGCPVCGCAMKTELSLVIHLNDDHRFTFSEIARKLGPDSA